MRSLIAFFLFGITIELSAQIPVFQVLYAEKASLSNGTPLKSLDKLLDETILVTDSGYLVLIHETGIPVELNSDTTVMLNEVHNILNPPSSRKSGKKIDKKATFAVLYGSKRTIGLDFLFITNQVEARKTKLNRTGHCADCWPNNGIKYPPLINDRIYYDADVKIVWDAQLFENTELRNGFKATFKNFYDDSLRTIDVNGRELILSKEEILEITNKDLNIILSITDQSKHGLPIGVAMSPFYAKAMKFPYSKEITSAAAALLIGYFFETTILQESTEAQAYYELATQLSDKQFYKEMLSNYLKRSGQ